MRRAAKSSRWEGRRGGGSPADGPALEQVGGLPFGLTRRHKPCFGCSTEEEARSDAGKEQRRKRELPEKTERIIRRREKDLSQKRSR